MSDSVGGYICYCFRDTLKTSARTETILLAERDGKVARIRPRWIERSRTGAHGKDCYLPRDIERAVAVIRVEISNSGKHYCSLELKKDDPITAERVLKWLKKFEHLCPSMFGLPYDE